MSWLNFSSTDLNFRMASSCGFHSSSSSLSQTNQTSQKPLSKTRHAALSLSHSRFSFSSFSCFLQKYRAALTSSKHNSDPSQTSSSLSYADTVWTPEPRLGGIIPEVSERETLWRRRCLGKEFSVSKWQKLRNMTYITVVFTCLGTQSTEACDTGQTALVALKTRRYALI